MEQSVTERIVDQLITYKGNFTDPLISIFNIEYIIGILDRTKIESIDKIYRSKQDGFNLLEFIRFFLNVIEHQESETLYLTIALIDFFKQISKSSGYNEKLFFVDITNYICNRILQKRTEENQLESNYILDYRTIKPNYKIKDYLIHPPKIYSNKDESVYKLSANKIKIDKMKHESVVTNCYFSKTLQKVFTLDVLSDSISIYNTSCNLVKKIKPNFLKFKKDIVVLAFAYSERQERVGAVLKDFSINFWDNSDNFEFQKSISAATYCQEYQTNIWFFQYFNSWVTSDKTGYLYVWNLETQKPEKVIKLAYENKINDLCVIPCLNLIAVVQERKVDPLTMSKKENEQKPLPTIMIYDYFKGDIVTKIELSPTHRIPHTLQYSETYHALLSAGYQKKISIFEINKVFLDTSHKGQLTGHQSLITCFTLLKKSPMVVSADDKGKVKIWDIRNYKCVQTLDFRDKTNITRLLDMIELGKIGVLGSRINFVEFDEKIEIHKKMNVREKLVPYWLQFDYNSFKIILLTKKDLRVYDLKKGTLTSIYCQFHNQQVQITFFKYLESLEKFIIGNQKGEIRLYSTLTGHLQAKLINHSASVFFVEYDQLNKIFITMGQDSIIQIQKQMVVTSEIQIEEQFDGRASETPKSREDKNSYLLREIRNNFTGKQLNVGAVSIYHGFIAVGGYSNSVYLWDYQFSKLLAQINLPNSSSNAEPTSMAFINGFSILLIGTSEGGFYCIKISRKEQTISMNLVWSYTCNEKEPITHIAIDTLLKGFTLSEEKLVKCKVYLANQSGVIFCVDMGSIHTKIEQQSSATNKQSFNAERHLRQNFAAEIQKKKYIQFDINSEQPIFRKNQFPVISFEAHKSCLTGIQIIELDERYLATIGLDQRLKIWKGSQLIGDLNINLPLPYKWQLNISDEQKTKQKIMFGLKILQKIFTNYGNDISINESKALRVRKLFEELDCNDRHLTEPELAYSCEKEKKITLFQNEFSKEDMHYDLVKRFNFGDIAGPTLKEIEVQKKLDTIQKEWQSNKQKTEQQKVKLLTSIRMRAHKNQEKDQIIQFLEEKNHFVEKPKDPLEKHPFINRISSKLQNLSTPKLNRADTSLQYLKITSQTVFTKEKNMLLGKEKLFTKSSSSLLKQKAMNSKKPQTNQFSSKTFETYYDEKLSSRDQNKENFRVSRLQTANINMKGRGFRKILHQMNERMQKSKKSIKKHHDLQDIRQFLISTSDGRRNKF